MITQKSIYLLTRRIIGYAIEVHKELGPGLLESVYETCLTHLLILNGHNVKRQLKVPVFFKGIELDADLRFDLLVDDLIIVELEAVETVIPVFEAQLLTYMKLLKKPKGILINFNSPNIVYQGQFTRVNEYYSMLPKD